MFAKRLIDKASRKKQSTHSRPNLSDEVQLHLEFHYGVPTRSKSLAYDRVQKILAVSTEDGRIKLFGSCNSQALFELERAAPSKFFQFVENEGMLLKVTIENHIEVWDIVGKKLSYVYLFPEEITSFTVLQQKSFVYVGDRLGDVSILKVNVEKCQLEQMQYRIPFSESHGANENGNSCSMVMFMLPQPMAESRRLLIIFKDGAISVWGIQESKVLFFTGGSPQYSESAEAREVTSACWVCPYGSKVVVGYNNGEINIWSIPKTSEGKFSYLSNQRETSSASGVPFLKLNLIYKVNKIPVVSLWYNFADGKAPRLYINGVSDFGSSFQVVLLNEKTETRTVKLVLPLPEACLDTKIISGFDERNQLTNNALVVLLKSGQLCMFNESEIENYLLCSQSKSLPKLPKQLNIRIPYINSNITVAKLFPERSDMPNMASQDYMSPSRMPSLFSADLRDGNIQFPSHTSGFAEPCKLYITGHQDGSISFWDASCYLLVPIISIKHQGEDCDSTDSPVTSLHFDASSRCLICGYQSGLVCTYTFKATQSVTDSIFSFLQGKPGCSYTICSVKLNGAIQTICLNPQCNGFAVGTDRGYVYAVRMEGMTILYQKQFASELAPPMSIVSLQFCNCVLDGNTKDVLLIAMGDSSILAVEAGTGQMVGLDIIKCKKPKRALFIQCLDMNVTSSHQPLLLHCSERSIRLYSLPYAIQGIKKIHSKKVLHGRCCWASTFYGSLYGCGLALIFTNCKMEIRSLPELNLLKEMHLKDLTFSESLSHSTFNVLSSSSDGNLVVARGDQEIIFYSLIKKDPDRLFGLVSQVYMKNVADAWRLTYLSNNHSERKRKMGIFSGILKDKKETKVKEEGTYIEYNITNEELSDLFATCNFPLIAGKVDGLSSDDGDHELDIDDIDIEDSEDISVRKSITTLNKQLGKKLNAIKGKLKSNALKKLEVEEETKSMGTVNEIKKRYGYSMTSETSMAKVNENKLRENLNKLQGISLRTSEMQSTAQSFLSAAKELLHTVEQKK